MSVLDLIPGPLRLYASWALAAAVAAAVAGAAWWHHQVKSAALQAADAAGYGRGHAEWVALDQQMTRTALRATEQRIEKEQADQARVDNAKESYAQLQRDHARAIVAQRHLLADNGRLRDEIAAYAAGPAGGGGAGEDSTAAASARAAALGQLLAEALRSDAERAADAEANADAVRTLLEAWPR